MNLASTLQRFLRWAAVGSVTAVLTVLAVQPGDAGAVPGTAYIYRGIALEPQWCWSWNQFPPNNTCWHDDESGTYTAIDFNWGVGDEDAWKLAQLWYTGTRQYIKFYSLSGTNSNGLRVEFYHDSAKTLYAGQLHYLHVIPYGGVVGSGHDFSGDSYYYRDLGEISGDEPDGCAWTGAHLHQSADTSASTSFYTNWTGNPTSDWVHMVQ